MTSKCGHLTGFLLVNLDFSGLGIIFDMFWSGKRYFGALRANPETSGRDLAVGMDEAWYGTQI